MNHLEIAQELSRNKEVFRGLLHGVESRQYLWRPQPEKWCLLEILCHLYDEEREDFRMRVQLVLQNPQLSLPPIDPQGWVTSRKYMEQDYDAMLDSFLNERDQSVLCLRGLRSPDWEQTYVHPKLGAMPASLFLHNWLAHDYLHFRQITATKYAYLKAHSTDPLDYAGNW